MKRMCVHIRLNKVAAGRHKVTTGRHKLAHLHKLAAQLLEALALACTTLKAQMYIAAFSHPIALP